MVAAADEEQITDAGERLAAGEDTTGSRDETE
jgi:hypothetical protein